MTFVLSKDKIYFLRQRKGLTRNALAAAAGVSIGTAIKAEKGKPIREGSAYKIAKALETDVSELL